MEGLSHYKKEKRPWGDFERFTENEPTSVKILRVKSGEAFSLQTHERRDEFWRVLAGSGIVHIGEKESEAREGDTFFAPRHLEHRITAGPEGIVVLEISFGDFAESDVTRLLDRYGRA